MADTYGQIWNRVLLYAPGTPPMIVQTMVKNAYQKILGRHEWSELYMDGEHTVVAEVSDTVNMTQGSTTVQLVGLTAASTWVGRVARFKDSPRFYYITAVNTGSNQLTLDTGYQPPTETGITIAIGEYYVLFPSDLKTLDDVRDKRNNWRLRRMFHQQNYIDLIDPKRTHTGYPALYVAARPFTDPSSGVMYPAYEFWPRLSAETPLIYRYVKVDSFSSNTDLLQEMIRPEAVLFGALAELCIWPGSTEKPNPYFNLELHARYTTMFEDALQLSIMNDLNRSQHMLQYEDSSTGYPVDARFWQAHGIVPR